MPRRWRRAREYVQVAAPRSPRPQPHPLLPPSVRPLAAAMLAVCAAVTALLGAWFAGQTRAGWLDRGVDLRLQASLGGHRHMLNRLAGLGDPIPVIVLTVLLLVGCLALRRWRGAVLVAVAVPLAAVITELLLKPLVGRTLQGQLSLPSGHATKLFALAAALAVLLVDPVRPRLPAALRLILALAAMAAAGANAIAIASLGLHYFTDTVAGAAVGIGVVLATALVLDLIGRTAVAGAVTAASGTPRQRLQAAGARERGAGDDDKQQDDGADQGQQDHSQCPVPAPAWRGSRLVIRGSAVRGRETGHGNGSFARAALRRAHGVLRCPGVPFIAAASARS